LSPRLWNTPAFKYHHLAMFVQRTNGDLNTALIFIPYALLSSPWRQCFPESHGLIKHASLVLDSNTSWFSTGYVCRRSWWWVFRRIYVVARSESTSSINWISESWLSKSVLLYDWTWGQQFLH
jgi:hypothetical protein